MTRLLLSRRSFLIGCGAASPLFAPVTFAAAPGENRLVVILLRGAMDGLDVVRPLGDPDYAALRPRLLSAVPDTLPLDGYFGLHPALAGIHPLWAAGEFAFAHAVALPYRQGRSHFVAQDALENGSGDEQGTISPARDGWLNRAISLIPRATPEMGVSVGQERLMILDGSAPTGHWYPADDSRLSSQARLLLSELHRADPLTGQVFAEAMELATLTDDERIPREAQALALLGGYVAERLRAQSRIAAFSLGGWDTHQRQANTLTERLGALSSVITGLKAGLGRDWSTTLVLALTEFGRTARENGSGGTDHGTGGVMLAFGGALRGGRAYGTWPGLSETALLEDRDLMPTDDLRRYPAHALRSLFGLDAAVLESVVFPNLDMGPTTGMVL
jgi:uncharacterized protein (DUF1501 family)